MNSSKSEFVLIAAPSGRALAQAARTAGYLPLVADFFDDLDTRDLSSSNCLVEGDLDQGFEANAIMAALTLLAESKPILGVIYGAGFEDRPDVLKQMAEHWPLFGNTPVTVALVKNPSALAALCTKLGIPHPEICFETPANNAPEWLIKHAGGSGGVHINSADGVLSAAGDYYQRHVAGQPVSSLVLADGAKASVLGFSEQWACPAPGQPWRFGGCAQPAALETNLARDLTNASQVIAEAVHLVGLNSIDFLVDGSDFHLIEINPRPGATLDIFHDRDSRLLHAHIEACKGRMPQEPLRFETAEAAAFVFAPCAIPSMPAWDWPTWTADRQKPSTSVAEHDPLCTVMASGADLASARRLLDERAAHILARVSKTDSKREAAA